MYEKIKQKIQTDTLASHGSSQRSELDVIRSYKDEGIRQKNKKKRRNQPSQDYMRNDFGGFSYQDDLLHYGRNNESNHKNSASGRKEIQREASSISVTRKKEKDLRKSTTGRVKHRARGKHRDTRLKLDKALVDQDPIIRKSLQSEGYYRRHRQKARNNISVPSSTSQSKTPKGGSLVRKKKKKNKKRLPAFQHIPLSFMNTATPKPKKKGRKSKSRESQKTSDKSKYFIVDEVNNSPEFHYNREGERQSKKSNSRQDNNTSSRLELDHYLLEGGVQSTMKSSADHRKSREDDLRKKLEREENQILRSYGHNEYHNLSKLIQNKRDSGNRKNRSKKGKSSSRYKQDSRNESKQKRDRNKMSKKLREQNIPMQNISESYSGLKKTSQVLKGNKSSKNFSMLRNSSHHHKHHRPGYARGEKENQSDLLQLSPSLQMKNNKISASYNDYYKPKTKSKMMKRVSKLIALDEAEEFYLQSNSDLYNQIRKNNQNFDHSKQRKKTRASNKLRKSNYEVEYNGQQKHVKVKKERLTLDIENLENPKLTHTHYPKTSYLPPQNPSGMLNFPNSTKNSRNKRPSRKTTDSSGNVPLCLLSLNKGREDDDYRRSKHKKGGKTSSLKRRSKNDYEDYKNYGESYVELEDGTRNYNVEEYQKTDSNEKDKKRKSSKSKKKRKRRHKKGSSSFGGFGQLYETYGDKMYQNRDNRDLEKMYKMKIMASRDASHPKDNLLNFGGAQWK